MWPYIGPSLLSAEAGVIYPHLTLLQVRVPKGLSNSAHGDVGSVSCVQMSSMLSEAWVYLYVKLVYNIQSTGVLDQ